METCLFASPYDSRKQQNTHPPNVDTRGSGSELPLSNGRGTVRHGGRPFGANTRPTNRLIGSKKSGRVPPGKSGILESGRPKAPKGLQNFGFFPRTEERKTISKQKEVPFRGLQKKARNGLFFIEQI